MADANERPLSGLSPHLSVSNAAAAIDFYKNAFGAVELTRHLAPDGKRIMHAAVFINQWCHGDACRRIPRVFGREAKLARCAGRHTGGAAFADGGGGYIL